VWLKNLSSYGLALPNPQISRKLDWPKSYKFTSKLTRCSTPKDNGQPEGTGAHLLSLTVANAGALIYSEGSPCKLSSNQRRPDALAVNKGDCTTGPDTTLRPFGEARIACRSNSWQSTRMVDGDYKDLFVFKLT